MDDLQRLAQKQSQWSLNEFVQVANQLLPQFLTDSSDKEAIAEEINPRLVRYYASQGWMDKPMKHGREARYLYRHLLQLLVIRRFLGEGYGSNAIAPLTTRKTDNDLESLLRGGVQITVEAANPALAFLNQVKQRQRSPQPSDPPQSRKSPLQSPVPSADQDSLSLSPTESQAKRSLENPEIPHSWVRIQVLPGLELHVRDDFQHPKSAHEQQRLISLIARKLESIATYLRSRRSGS